MPRRRAAASSTLPPAAPWRKLPVSCTSAVRRGSSTTPGCVMLNDSVPRTRLWGACARLLERAGYIERVSVYDNADDLASGTPNTLVRLTGDSVAPRQLVIDDNALQQRKQLELQKIRRMVGYANARQCRRQKMLA